MIQASVTKSRLLPVVLSFALSPFFSSELARAWPDDNQVATEYAAWASAFNRADPAALAQLYTSDAIVLAVDHQVIKGSTAVGNALVQLIAAGLTDYRFEPIEAYGNGQLLIGTARWSARGRAVDGEPSLLGGNVLNVYELQSDGKWLLRAQMFN